MKCSVDTCDRSARSGGMCNRHYEHMRRHGYPVSLVAITPDGEAAKRSDGYMRVGIDGRRVMEHVAIAEKALGKPLPPGAEVHHVDENRANNANTNLVICPDTAYHQLLHRRARALDACGNADWRKCTLCKQYDAPANLIINGYGHVKHKTCANEYAKRRHHIRKALIHFKG